MNANAYYCEKLSEKEREINGLKNNISTLMRNNTELRQKFHEMAEKYNEYSEKQRENFEISLENLREEKLTLQKEIGKLKDNNQFYKALIDKLRIVVDLHKDKKINIPEDIPVAFPTMETIVAQPWKPPEPSIPPPLK
tara:strand:+ start:414 stop:827 length:414 start_codon:yes stop_codon:yes gene_type:complete